MLLLIKAMMRGKDGNMTPIPGWLHDTINSLENESNPELSEYNLTKIKYEGVLHCESLTWGCGPIQARQYDSSLFCVETEEQYVLPEQQSIEP